MPNQYTSKRPVICGIYMIVNHVTGDRYIGQSVNILKRFTYHKAPSTWDSKLHQDILKMGTDNFYILILEECEPKDLDELEKKWIKLCEPEYNISLGGKGTLGYKHTEDAKRRCRQAAIKQWQTMDDATKQKIIKNLTGHKVGYIMSDETKKK